MDPVSRRGTGTGPGRVLVALYGVFAVAATGRSVVQLSLQASEAPFPYALSALAALVYVAATVGLAVDRPWSRRLAWTAVGVELVGVLVVGTLSLADPVLFPDDTVWSGYGRGYGFLPLVLPFLGLAWLLRTRPTKARPSR
ncbi:hypothetical protein [Nocardioides sp. CFH 31398]|uniref:hypothetical protein n=1 Tax=Nocardioides sp. CFH 31398 TaxID=2919579 RepID=UPI001F06B33B|nr:hypothetical protein [Nocardioides sp. CFH 31398]MCH1867882.1 hypothetical protein [Nocardioides sp. CFH 31398]